jgi:protein-disulfide isomerase
MAAQLALDATRFVEDLDSVSAHQRLDEDRRQSRSLNVAATPTFFVNGVRLTGPRSLAELSAQIDAAIAATRGANLGR